MTFERRFQRVAVKEKKKKEFFEGGHLSDYGMEEWIYGDCSWNSRRKQHKLCKEHLASCQECSAKITAREQRDQGGKSAAIPTHDR